MAVNDVIKLLKENELSERLPSSYNIENTKIKYIMEAIQDELNELYQAIIDVEKLEDMDFMFGKSIDFYGEDCGEYRNGTNDSEYKNKIK